MSHVGKVWWGRRFLERLQAHTVTGRLARGKHQPNGRRITDWRITGRRVAATGSSRSGRYYGGTEAQVFQSALEFPPIPSTAWDEVIHHIGGRAGLLSQLLLGEMPSAIEEPLAELGLSLLPQSIQELGPQCSCHERDLPCTHLASLCRLLADRLDRDPFLLFELRGLPRSDLARRLRATPLGHALAAALTETPDAPEPRSSYFTRPEPRPVPDSVTVRDFWRGGKPLPPNPEPPTTAAVPAILIRKGGDYPPFWEQQRSFVETMDAFYEQVRKRAKDWL